MKGLNYITGEKGKRIAVQLTTCCNLKTLSVKDCQKNG